MRLNGKNLMLAPPEMCLDLEPLDFGSAPTSVVKGVARHAEVALHYICHQQSLPGPGGTNAMVCCFVVLFELLLFDLTELLQN